MAEVRGLIFSPSLTSDRVTSLEMTFEPSIGIMARKMDKLGMDIRSFKEPLQRAIRDVVIPSIATNFAKHGRPRWPDLAEDTETRRLSEGTGWRILDRSGALKKAMRRQDIWHVDREKALLPKLPSNVFYGGIHQAGARGSTTHTTVKNIGAKNFKTAHSLDITEGDGDIPQRRFVMLQPQDNEAIERVFAEWLDERILRAGLGSANNLGGL